MGPLGHSVAALSALAALPVGLAGLALRPELRVGLGERLGTRPATAPGAIWVHGASVGEVQACLPLIEGLRASGAVVTASAMTLTGRELLRRSCPDVASALAPLDHPWCVDRALKRVAPSLLVLVETELWPCWIRGCRARGIPVMLASARLSDRSFPRYQRFARWLRPTLEALERVAARSPRDAERFAALGVPAARIQVTGDLKLEPPPRTPRLAPELADLLGSARLIVAGSTHPDEEAAALAALERSESAGLAAALVLAPRHPKRFDAVAELVVARGRVLRRRSQAGGPPLTPPLAPGEVLLLDSVGELAAIYTRAEVVFVGGSLVPRGGHNPLEAARAGRAVLMGPHRSNLREAEELLLGCAALVPVADAAGLGEAVLAALRDPEGWAARGARAAERLEANRGAAERTLALIRAVRGEA